VPDVATASLRRTASRPPPRAYPAVMNRIANGRFVAAISGQRRHRHRAFPSAPGPPRLPRRHGLPPRCRRHLARIKTSPSPIFTTANPRSPPPRRTLPRCPPPRPLPLTLTPVRRCPRRPLNRNIRGTLNRHPGRGRPDRRRVMISLRFSTTASPLSRRMHPDPMAPNHRPNHPAGHGFRRRAE
jgi:hypothetical protein